jgi:hypothetical protein
VQAAEPHHDPELVVVAAAVDVGAAVDGKTEALVGAGLVAVAGDEDEDGGGLYIGEHDGVMQQDEVLAVGRAAVAVGAVDAM